MLGCLRFLKSLFDSVLRIVSMTKAVGVTAALILEQRGLLDWSERVEDIVPSFSEAWRHRASSRRRASASGRHERRQHSSTSPPILAVWDTASGTSSWRSTIAQHAIPPVNSGKLAALRSPLLEEPGEDGDMAWASIGSDSVIEAISGENMTSSAGKRCSSHLEWNVLDSNCRAQ